MTPHDPMSGSARWAGLVLAEACARFAMGNPPHMPLTEEEMGKYPTCAVNGAKILGSLLMALPGDDSLERASICYHAGHLAAMLLTREHEIQKRYEADVAASKTVETVDYSKDHQAVLMEGAPFGVGCVRTPASKPFVFSVMCVETQLVACGWDTDCPSYRLAVTEKNLFRISLHHLNVLCGGKHYL